MTRRGLGWRHELPDYRDDRYRLALRGAADRPAAVDLRDRWPPILDQGATNSCVGHAWASMLDFLHPDPAYASGVQVPSSRRFIYWGANVRAGTAGRDEGAYIRDGAKVVAGGVPHELACRFSVAKITTPPNKVAFTQASRRRKIASYHPIRTKAEMLQCLADGYPFVAGFTVYSNMLSEEVDRTGEIPMPAGSIEGGHAITVCGYDGSHFLFANSWSPAWGEDGFGRIPLEYLANPSLADDCWTARL